jgi:hypothetical protein
MNASISSGFALGLTCKNLGRKLSIVNWLNKNNL